MLYAIETTLSSTISAEELTFRPNEEANFAEAKERRYLALALDSYAADPTILGSADLAPSPEELAQFKANRDKPPPYTPREKRFILMTIATKIRELPGVPSNLVASVSGKLRRRTPLLTPLVVLARVVERNGRRMKIKAQILSKGGRVSAWEPEDPEGGTFGTAQAEAEGEAVILWARDSVAAKI
jgi:hypothetical protein